MMDALSQSVFGTHDTAFGSEEKLRLLVETGLLLASERSLDTITQAALDAGRTLCDASYGVFFYPNPDPHGHPDHLVKVSSADLAFAQTASRSITALVDLPHLFETTQHPHGFIRIDDTTQYGPLPFSGLPPTRSHMALPVRHRSGDFAGAIVYGHPEPNIFTGPCEGFMATIASQAARAMENVRLGASLSNEIALADSARALQRETAERLRQALDAAQLGTWTWDRETDLLDLDERAAHLFGVRRGERITRTALRERVVVPEDFHHTVDRLRNAIETAGNYSAEYRIENASGKLTWVYSTGVPNLSVGTSEIIGMVGTVQDITARKVHEETIRESEKLAATGRLAATIAHEINNPLEAITNLIYLSRTDPGVPQAVKELLQTADSELARVSKIAQQTLGFYRDTTRPVSINMTELLLSIADLFTRKMRSKGVSCTVDLERDFHIFGLQGEIRQVFSNLVVNAIDASSHSAIHIRSRKQCHNGIEGLSIMIQDSGSGIPAAVRDQLFSPFVTTKQSSGTGLGLWVTRGIIEKQGGTVSFRTSTETPSGTIFRVFLPVRPPSAITPHQP
jgi:PAS domain S-box-containing protein